MKAHDDDPAAGPEAGGQRLEELVEHAKLIVHLDAQRLKRALQRALGLGQALGATMPEGAIVVDESVTTGRGFFPFSAGAPPHDWLNNMGGSIGFGGPVAVGAAVA